jgi:hypothetical protein
MLSPGEHGVDIFLCVGGWHADPAQIRKHGEQMRDIALELSRMPDQLADGPSGFSATVALERRSRSWLEERNDLARSVGGAGDALENTARAYELSDEQFMP